jgi:hypothetical protein
VHHRLNEKASGENLGLFCEWVCRAVRRFDKPRSYTHDTSALTAVHP